MPQDEYIIHLLIDFHMCETHHISFVAGCYADSLNHLDREIHIDPGVAGVLADTQLVNILGGRPNPKGSSLK